MSSLTVRISVPSHKILRKLSALTGEPMQEILSKAIEEYRRRCFLEQANEDFAALRRNAKAWKHERAERALWERTLRDGLESD